MPKIRELTHAERFYIENNSDKTDAQLASTMPGIGPKSIAKFRNDLPTETKKEKDVIKKAETPEQRVNRLARGPKAGELMARNKNGAVVMTEAASEILDARKVMSGTQQTKEEYRKNNRNRIHTIDPNKPSQ
ncbi:uncharacterized protein METZ01_LOCUS432241 [marine metagenome]|uniref:Uncharacterized protein n=1 Tax=marine metagenome TaxID=408172 RepID=A0A382Y7T0_9ZZZZ